eukprot:COSAG04_NODE_32105_length_253_cov_0.662338_2_plen_49_part_01
MSFVLISKALCVQTELPVEPAHFGMEHLSAATNYMSKVLGMATGRDPST